MKQLSRKKKQHSLLIASNRTNSRNIITTSSAIHKNDVEQVEVTAPTNFSIINNAEEVTSFFRDIKSYLSSSRNKTINMYFRLDEVQQVTTDAIMYLLALIKNLQKQKLTKHKFSGNAPADKRAKEIFVQSGFYDFVNSKMPKITNADKITIRTGQSNDSKVLKEICDFIIEKANTTRVHTRFLYKMMAEMMYNTHEHAYETKSAFLKNWYIYVELSDKCIKTTFLDTGLGIPSTMRVKLSEKILNSPQNELILAALNGENLNRSRTKLPYRNNGLPTIKKYAENKNIYNLHIISNRAVCKINDASGNMTLETYDQRTSIMGTIYYWEVPIESLQGE